MKVKFFNESDLQVLESKINEFFIELDREKKREVIFVEHKPVAISNNVNSWIHYSALVVYDEQKMVEHPAPVPPSERIGTPLKFG